MFQGLTFERKQTNSRDRLKEQIVLSRESGLQGQQTKLLEGANTLPDSHDWEQAKDTLQESDPA